MTRIELAKLLNDEADDIDRHNDPHDDSAAFDARLIVADAFRALAQRIKK